MPPVFISNSSTFKEPFLNFLPDYGGDGDWLSTESSDKDIVILLSKG